MLEYHTKTRTVHTYSSTLLDAVVTSSASPTALRISSRSTTSTFPLAYHLPALALALRTSLTPTRTTPLATAVIQAVESAWKAFKDADKRERPAQKRKVTEDTDKSGREARPAPVQARVFAHTSRVAGSILSNLPANAYTEDDVFSLGPLWGDVGKLGWTVIWDCLGKKTGKGGEHDIMKGRESKKRRHASETGSNAAHYPHIVTSAALRFLYDVRARVSCLLGDSDRLGEADVGTLLNVAQDEASDPELVLETVCGYLSAFSSHVSYPLLYQIRTLLWHVWYTHNGESEKQMETEPIFTMILDILVARPLSGSKWSGGSAALTRDNLGLAVLYVSTERWSDLFE